MGVFLELGEEAGQGQVALAEEGVFACGHQAEDGVERVVAGEEDEVFDDACDGLGRGFGKVRAGGWGQARRDKDEAVGGVVKGRVEPDLGKVVEPETGLEEGEAASDRERGRREDCGQLAVVDVGLEHGRDVERRGNEREPLGHRPVGPIDRVLGVVLRKGGKGAGGGAELAGRPGELRREHVVVEVGRGFVYQFREFGNGLAGRVGVERFEQAHPVLVFGQAGFGLGKELLGFGAYRCDRRLDVALQRGLGRQERGEPGLARARDVGEELFELVGADVGAEVADAGVFEPMGLIEDDRVVFGQEVERADKAGEVKRVVGDHDAGLFPVAAGALVEAGLAIGAAVAAAGSRVARDPALERGRDRVRVVENDAVFGRVGPVDEPARCAGFVAGVEQAARGLHLQPEPAEVIVLAVRDRGARGRVEHAAGQLEVFGDELGLEQARVGRDDYAALVARGPDGRRNEVGEALAHAGAGFDGELAVAVERVPDALGHGRLLGTVLEPGNGAGEPAFGSEALGRVELSGHPGSRCSRGQRPRRSHTRRGSPRPCLPRSCPSGRRQQG